jgi:uncharacterized protein YceH (UPF0502 family)
MSESQLKLSASAARVLGALMEKEATTPEYYPLSLVALTAACNQRSSRNPVMELTEDEVRMALHQLEDVGLAGPVRGTEARVTKFAHHVGEVFNLRRGESAVLCVLLLRGAQTPGELRTRTERMHNFAALDEVEAALQQLAQREAPLARALPRERGSREVRYIHLLSALASSQVVDESGPDPAEALRLSGNESVGDRVAVLESELADMRGRVAALEDKLARLLE